MRTEKYTGVLLGTVEDDSGQMYIRVAVNSQCVTLTLSRALLLFEQLGDMLESLDVLDKTDDGYLETPKCH